jgi:hypothetical protein
LESVQVLDQQITVAKLGLLALVAKQLAKGRQRHRENIAAAGMATKTARGSHGLDGHGGLTVRGRDPVSRLPVIVAPAADAGNAGMAVLHRSPPRLDDVTDA